MDHKLLLVSEHILSELLHVFWPRISVCSDTFTSLFRKLQPVYLLDATCYVCSSDSNLPMQYSGKPTQETCNEQNMTRSAVFLPLNARCHVINLRLHPRSWKCSGHHHVSKLLNSTDDQSLIDVLQGILWANILFLMFVFLSSWDWSTVLRFLASLSECWSAKRKSVEMQYGIQSVLDKQFPISAIALAPLCRCWRLWRSNTGVYAMWRGAAEKILSGAQSSHVGKTRLEPCPVACKGSLGSHHLWMNNSVSLILLS